MTTDAPPRAAADPHPTGGPFLVPFARNDDLVGRDDDLGRLHELLAKSDAAGAQQPRALVGPGGIGKTQLAIEYAYRHRDAYSGGIYWVNAAEGSWQGELARLAVELGLDVDGIAESRRRMRLAEAFAAHLEKHPDSLVVFDDVDDPERLQAEATGFVAAKLACRVLFTTRSTDAKPWFAAARVAELPEDRALALLRSGKKRKATVDDGRPEEVAAARDVCRMFGGLPLAIVLAAGYLEDHEDVSLVGYRDRARAAGALAMGDAPDDRAGAGTRAPSNLATRHEAAVGAALRIQWDALSAEGARTALQAAAVLAEAAHVPRARLSLLIGAGERPRGGRLAPFEGALDHLQRLSLTERLTDGGIRLHPLVRQFVLTTIDVRPRFTAACAGTLADALWDPGRLDAEVAGRGVDAVRADLRAAAELAGDCVPDRVSRLLRTLDREAYCLRPWKPSQSPGFFLQQVRNRWFELGFEELRARAEAELDARGLPHVRARNRTGRDSAALVWTLGGATWAPAITPDGRFAIAGSNDSNDGTLVIWELASGQSLRTLEGHAAAVSSVAVTRDGRVAVSGSFDGSIKVWDLASGHLIRTLAGHPGSAVTGVAVTPDGRLAISASNDRTLQVWELASGQALRTLEGHTGSVNCVAVTPDGRFAVSGSSDFLLKVWELESGQLVYDLKGHSGFVYSVAVTPDGFAFSASQDGTLKGWNLPTGRHACTLAGGTDPWPGVAVTPDGDCAIAGAQDKTLKVWNLEYGQVVHTLGSTSGWVRGVAVTPDGRLAVSADGSLKVWDLASTQLVGAGAGHYMASGPENVRVSAVAVTPDGRLAVCASNNGTLGIWDLASGRIVRTLEGHARDVKGVAVTADGHYAVSVAMDHTLKSWDLASGQAVRTIELEVLARFWTDTACVAVAPDGRFAVSAWEDKTLKVWDLASGEAVRSLEGHTGLVSSVALTPDGRLAVSGSVDATLKSWDLATGQVVRTFEGHTGPVRDVAVTPDGRFALSASSFDSTIKVWELATGQGVHTLRGPTGDVAVTPDGRFAVSASGDTLAVWDLASGESLLRLETHGSLSCCAIAPDGRTVVAGGEDYGPFIFDFMHARTAGARG